MIDLVPELKEEKARKQIEKQTPPGHPYPQSRDLPITQPVKRIQAHAAKEAEWFGHKHIGCEHLLLALAREKVCLAAEILRAYGFEVTKAREKLRARPQRPVMSQEVILFLTEAEAEAWAVLFEWKKSRCEPRNALRNRANQRLFLHHGEVYDSSKFELIEGGWTHFRCSICLRNLYLAEDPTGNVGYTNGRDWLCLSCHRRYAALAGEPDGAET